MSSSSSCPTSPRDDDDCQQLAEAVNRSPFFKMAEEFKPQMVQMLPTTACSKMSEDSQDSSQGQGSSHSRCLIKSYCISLVTIMIQFKMLLVTL